MQPRRQEEDKRGFAILIIIELLAMAMVRKYLETNETSELKQRMGRRNGEEKTAEESLFYGLSRTTVRFPSSSLSIPTRVFYALLCS